MNFSVIIPVYNRPSEVDELLESLVQQTIKNFEIIIVEDGSLDKCNNIVNKYTDKLKIKYLSKENSGPGLSRNFGACRAQCDYIIFFDSDCIIPEKYFEIINRELNENYVDCFGGPDRAHSSFSNIQKAINYSMTSFLTTGGIRGGKKKVDIFYPRSFNMGISKEVFQLCKGYSNMRFGEDLDLSMRIMESNFKTKLIPDAFVYHKRRTNFKKFYKQVYNSGIARINLYKRHPYSLKLVHFFPSLFVGFFYFSVLLSFFNFLFIYPLILLFLLIFFDSLRINKSIKIAILSLFASFIQLNAYGIGFIKAFFLRIIRKKPEFYSYKRNFYK